MPPPPLAKNPSSSRHWTPRPTSNKHHTHLNIRHLLGHTAHTTCHIRHQTLYTILHHTCVHLIYVYMYINIFMIQKLLLFLSLILFLLTLQYTVWPGWGATYTSGLESTRGHHALKCHKYNLPLTPPPKKNGGSTGTVA